MSFPELPATGADTAPIPALLFALVAERLSIYYEHDSWLSIAQGATLAADWLGRNKQTLPLVQRTHLSTLSDTLARQIANSVSRAAGLHIAYEMTESLDPRHQSDTCLAMQAECARMLAEHPLPAER